MPLHGVSQESGQMDFDPKYQNSTVPWAAGALGCLLPSRPVWGHGGSKAAPVRLVTEETRKQRPCAPRQTNRHGAGAAPHTGSRGGARTNLLKMCVFHLLIRFAMADRTRRHSNRQGAVPGPWQTEGRRVGTAGHGGLLEDWQFPGSGPGTVLWRNPGKRRGWEEDFAGCLEGGCIFSCHGALLQSALLPCPGWDWMPRTWLSLPWHPWFYHTWVQAHFR